MGFTLAEVNEALAEAFPERDAIVTPNRRLSWRDFQRRTRQLAHLLIRHGLGCHRERQELAPWESGQDHLALYLYNSPEYLEGMIGAYKARVAPFNVNYRYVEEELAYLFNDARPKAIVYHAAFAPTLARVLPRLQEAPRLLLQVVDDSGEELLPGALDYEQALAEMPDEPPQVVPSPDDLYILYTGGTTGMPKGVLWRQEDIFFGALGGRVLGTAEEVKSLEQLVENARGGGELRVLPAPPFMHGAAHWAAFMMLHQGGAVVLPANVKKLDPADIWETIVREKVLSLTIVGDAFARPLIDELRTGRYQPTSLKVIGSGGAILSPSMKEAFLELLPDIMILDAFGASETGAQGSSVSVRGEVKGKPSFRMDENTCVLDADLTRRLRPDEVGVVGWLARTGRVPLGYLGDPEKTRRTYPTIDGIRYAVPGDRAELAPDGSIVVHGRDSVCINSGGEKIFAEEVEKALKGHPAVYDAVVVGTPNERWGQQVTAVVALRDGAQVTEDSLREAAARELARYKLPKAFVFVDQIVRAPSGKPDYRWAKATAEKALGISS